MVSIDTTSNESSFEFDYDDLAGKLAKCTDDDQLFVCIVNGPFSEPVPAAFIFLGIVVLLQVNKVNKTIERVALSDTELAHNTTTVSAIPFHDIVIPLDHYENIIAHAIASGEPTDTTDWKFLFEPALTPAQARMNQANSGVAYSAVHPLNARDGGALIYSYYQYQSEIGIQQLDFMQHYTQLVDEALGNPKP